MELVVILSLFGLSWIYARPPNVVRVVAVGLVGLPMLGCSSTLLSLEEATPAHWSHYRALQEPASPTDAIVKIVRDDTLDLGLGTEFRIAINGRFVGQVAEGELVTFYVPPGEVTLEARPPIGEWVNPYTTTLAPKETKYFRIGVHTHPMVWVPILGIFVSSPPESRGLFIGPYEDAYPWPDKEATTVMSDAW